MSEELETIEEQEDAIVEPADGSRLAPLEEAIASLADDAPTEAILQLREQLLFYKYESVRMLKLMDDRLIERIKTNGPVKYGNGIRFFLSHPKTTKCNDLKATIDAIGEASAGDENLFLGCFSKNALKHGACKKILAPDVYSNLFNVTVKDKLENGDPAPKRLTKLDEKFLK